MDQTPEQALDRVFMLNPRTSQIDPLADALAQALAARGESLESLLQALLEVRAKTQELGIFPAELVAAADEKRISG